MSKKAGTHHKNSVRSDAKFDDKIYTNIRFSATFDYDELCASRAAAQLAPRCKTALTGISMACLVLMIILLLMNKSNITIALVLMVIWFITFGISTNWHKFQLRYIRNTSLAVPIGGERRHVVVCDDIVHSQTEGEEPHSYPLNEIINIYATDESIVMGFGSKRYVYIPRSALSENRFRELARFLQQSGQ